MLRMIIQKRRKVEKGTAAAHAANVDDVANDKPHDPDSEPEEDKTKATLHPSEQEESSLDADSKPSLTSVPQGYEQQETS